jgi:hypothetical protein
VVKNINYKEISGIRQQMFSCLIPNDNTKKYSHKKTRQEKPLSEKEKGGKNPTGLSPRNRKACHTISTALLQSVAKIETQSPMESNRKTLHEF